MKINCSYTRVIWYVLRKYTGRHYKYQIDMIIIVYCPSNLYEYKISDLSVGFITAVCIKWDGCRSKTKLNDYFKALFGKIQAKGSAKWKEI